MKLGNYARAKFSESPFWKKRHMAHLNPSSPYVNTSRLGQVCVILQTFCSTTVTGRPSSCVCALLHHVWPPGAAESSFSSVLQSRRRPRSSSPEAQGRISEVSPAGGRVTGYMLTVFLKSCSLSDSGKMPPWCIAVASFPTLYSLCLFEFPRFSPSGLGH